MNKELRTLIKFWSLVQEIKILISVSFYVYDMFSIVVTEFKSDFTFTEYPSDRFTFLVHKS